VLDEIVDSYRILDLPRLREDLAAFAEIEQKLGNVVVSRRNALLQRILRSLGSTLATLALVSPAGIGAGSCHGCCVPPPSGERRGPRLAYVQGRRRRLPPR
jgi:hypothetical protein